MASQLGSMSINSNPPRSIGAAPPAARSGAYTPPPPAPKPAPTFRATGPYNEVITECPERSPIIFALDWYHLPEAPDFLVCSACHDKHIRSSANASSFERIERPDGVPSLCRFWLPRVVHVLWPAVLRSGDPAPLQEYASKRVEIVDCQGEGGVSADVGVKWFSAKNDQLPNVVSCEACFEDRIVGTAFESQFHPCPLDHRSGEIWACDFSAPHIMNAIKRFGSEGRNDWPSCVAAVRHRVKLPACQLQPVEMASCKWYTPRREIPDFFICETCYADKIALTEFEHEFRLWAPPQAVNLGAARGCSALRRSITAAAVRLRHV